MTWFITLVAGLLLGFAVGRTSAGKPIDWRKATIALLVGLVIAAAVSWWADHRTSTGGYACTQDAKQCPDGSYVGRVGPRCEFAACPTH